MGAIQNCALYSGITIDGNSSLSSVLEVVENPSSSGDTVIVDCTLKLKAEKRAKPSYKVQVVLSTAREHKDKSSQQRDINLSRDSSNARTYDGVTLFHGSYLQGIDEVVKMSKKRLTLRCHKLGLASD